MNYIDWTIIVVYLLAMVAFSVLLGRGQSSQEDYYVGGRDLPWWAIGISTMATQSSANSFIGIPAFVALTEGGGLAWLQYELAVPLAMIFVMVFLLPFFRQLKLVSVYEYLELRFNRATRLFLSGVFLISRALATGMGIYAAAIVLTACLEVPIWVTILVIGVVTIIYDTIGGMAAVVYSDVIQMAVLLVGVVICISYAAGEVGGLSEVISSLPSERWVALDGSSGLSEPSSSTPFWGFFVGGFFLYVSYYGVDQSQAQRELSAPTIEDTKRSLILNGLARFPMTLLYLAYAPLTLKTERETPAGYERMIGGLSERYTAEHILPTTSPVAEGFDPDRYWRGPVWVNMNWLFAEALEGVISIKKPTLQLLERAGFYEYFNPQSGEGLGSGDFTWSAALCLDWQSG